MSGSVTSEVYQTTLRVALQGTPPTVFQSTLRVASPYVMPVSPWIAVAAAKGPALVQSTTIRGNTSPLTVTLTAAATAGNLLLVIQGGYAEALTPPTGFTALYDGHADASNNGTQAWTKTAVGGETSLAFTGATNYHSVYVFEISAAGVITTAHGAAGGAGTTNFSIPSLLSTPSSTMRFMVIESDSAGAFNANLNNTSQAFEALPTTFDSNAYPSAVFAIAPTESGTLAIPWSVSLVNPAYGYIAIAYAPIIYPGHPFASVPYSAVTLSTGTAGTATATNTVPSVEVATGVKVAQTYGEVMAANPSPPATTSQLYGEVVAANPNLNATVFQFYAELVVSTRVANNVLSAVVT